MCFHLPTFPTALCQVWRLNGKMYQHMAGDDTGPAADTAPGSGRPRARRATGARRAASGLAAVAAAAGAARAAPTTLAAAAAIMPPLLPIKGAMLA